MSLNLAHLRAFAAVAEHGGFSRAAIRLRVSQPAVSKAVRELERRLDIALVDRSGRRPRLTEAGLALFTRARELFGLEQIAEEELRAMRGVERGILRVGASTTIATYLLPPLLARFRAKHPGVTLRVASANTRAVARLLLDRRVDVALVEGPVTHARIAERPWRRDQLIVIAAADHALARRRRVPSASLAGEMFIERERGSGTREVAAQALANRRIVVRRAMELGSTEAIKQAVAAGLGLAIVSRAAAEDQLALGRIAELHVSDFEIERTLTQLELRGRPVSAAARAFEGILAERPSTLTPKRATGSRSGAEPND